MTKMNQRNVVLFPFMAQGHLTPFLAFGRQIEQRKIYRVNIVSTPLNIQKLKSLLSSNTDILLVEIPFCATDYGLPCGSENTDSMSFIHTLRFMEASENLESPFKKLLEEMTESDGAPPVCIISDMFLGWTVKVAKELGIFHSVFIAGAAYSMALYFSMSLNSSLWRIADDEFSIPDFPEASRICRSRIPIDLKYVEAASFWFSFCQRQFTHCLSSDAILLNTIQELEDAGLEYFRRKTGRKPVWTVGPASLALIKSRRTWGNDDYYSEWLNIHPPVSVLYVCFGSMCSISASQMKELALGLEATCKAFIWVARPPTEFGLTEEFRTEWLPDGFEKRMKKRNQGLLIHKLAPQNHILSHKSIGAFLSHCGWNSILEITCRGIPIIGWLMGGEQFFNSNMLEKRGVCLELRGGDNAEVIRHEHISEVIRKVMDSTQTGLEMKRKAGILKLELENAIKEDMGFKGSSVKALDQFLGVLEVASLSNASINTP